MTKTVGIAGAGLAGRLLALQLARRGWQVTLFDRDGEDGRASCTYASAGMLAPSCELESAEREVSVLGTSSLKLWPELLKSLAEPVFYRQNGSVVVAHPNDEPELQRLKNKVLAGSPHPEFMKELGGRDIEDLEPELAGRFRAGLFLADEGHLDNRAALRALAAALRQLKVTWHSGVSIDQLEPHAIRHNSTLFRFDWVADCRGLGAQADLKSLRGVRGELVYVSAPEVHLRRPVRLMHPRYPIYIVPRDNHLYVIGATAVESEDLQPITVRSILELLSAAYTVHTGFAEARLMETVVHCRPAFPDNRPRIFYRDGLLRINGLYRHGFLLAPILVQFALEYLENRLISSAARPILQEIP